MLNEAKRVVIFGGTGFIGLSLARLLLSENYAVFLIARHTTDEVDKLVAQYKQDDERCRFLAWDAEGLGPWVSSLESATAVINLAGRTVDCIKTPENVDVILRSRVETTRLIGRALRALETPPRIWVQMSTAHIYGDPPTARCTEQSAYGYGLAPDVGQAWEAAHVESLLPQMRSVILRTSFVLGTSGGALPTLALLCKLRLGGTVGSGTQGMSWLHEADMNRIMMRALEDQSMSGAYIATAPNPVSNKHFMKALRQSLGVRLGLPTLTWMVKMWAPLLFNTDPELALYGRYCIPQRLLDEKFEFLFSDLDAALTDLFNH